MKNNSLSFLIVLTVSGCAIYSGVQLDEQYGKQKPRERIVANLKGGQVDYWNEVKPILDKRCVVCHGCYDAPCQLNLGSPEGIDRGASKSIVFANRLIAEPPTRLFEDAQKTEQWREKGFFPVLNERDQTPTANLDGSILARMLELKRKHPSPKGAKLPEDMDFSLDRAQQCSTIEEFDRFEGKFPLWGMPFGLPGLKPDEHTILVDWLKQGANSTERVALPDDVIAAIHNWETFLNGDSYKHQLMSRYIYEHLFLGHLYFSELPSTTVHNYFFKLARSKSPPGNPIELIATPRPYDDPGVSRVYYRMQLVRTTLVSKTHMPYALNSGRMARYQELFIKPDYVVNQLPRYDLEVASNPFIAFKDIPTKSRYKFMLDEAQYTIMGFIKGPVCRGRIALNVINDRFWVLFIDPDTSIAEHNSEFLARQSKHLRLPSEEDGNAMAFANWKIYSALQNDYLKAKTKFISENLSEQGDITLDLIWDGNGKNRNAALTIFRHFDSASVVKGLVGSAPKTAWIVGYPLLERIHYLLVAGFDIYGNIGHQLNTRLYMDFLRMEAEFNFLTLLPKELRLKIRDHWYRNATEEIKDYIYGRHLHFNQETGITFKTDDPKSELFTLLKLRLKDVLNHSYDIPSHVNRVTIDNLTYLSSLQGTALSWLPQVSFLSIIHEKTPDAISPFTIINNSAYSNITNLFGDDQNRLPDEDTLTIVNGFIGDYPNAFYTVSEERLGEFIQAIENLSSEEDYVNFMDQFGIRRTNQLFWQHSDKLHSEFKKLAPIEAALFDYNRLENR